MIVNSVVRAYNALAVRYKLRDVNMTAAVQNEFDEDDISYSTFENIIALNQNGLNKFCGHPPNVVVSTPNGLCVNSNSRFDEFTIRLMTGEFPKRVVDYSNNFK